METEEYSTEMPVTEAVQVIGTTEESRLRSPQTGTAGEEEVEAPGPEREP